MSDQMMDTDPGGESTQYESIQTETLQTPKSGGQMGQPETVSQNSKQTTANMAADAQSQGLDSTSGSDSRDSKPEKYENEVASGGAGGRTTDSSGSADEADGGFAGTSAEGSRRAEGYGGSEDMDKSIGG